MAGEGVYLEADSYDWMTWADADSFVLGLIEDFMSVQGRAAEMKSSIRWGTSTRFIDWIDHMIIPEESVDEDQLAYMGYIEETSLPTMYGARVFVHPSSYFFPILLRPGQLRELAIKVSELDDFRKRHLRYGEILGDPFAQYRWMNLVREHEHVLTAVERRGYAGFSVEEAYDVNAYKTARDAFRTRERSFPNDEEAFDHIEALIREQLEDLTVDRTADAWFRAEWEYWEAHNHAAQAQKARQDQLGLGWANHDHQAYRCSRENFVRTVDILRLLGLKLRESFYAGSQAGWGAQVMEHPTDHYVVFCDVDLAPEEKDEQFALEGLEPREELGTIGMWTSLHGESMLQAGLHHLACRFDFKRIIDDLESRGFDSMTPFSNLDFLKQTFTLADVWLVDQERAGALLAAGHMDEESFERFGAEGAIGSHMELIERNEGFKGFNQDSVSAIIAATDPRAEPPDVRYA